MGEFGFGGSCGHFWCRCLGGIGRWARNPGELVLVTDVGVTADSA